MSVNYNNDHCRIAANMLGTELGLLDYRLVDRLNEIDSLVNRVNHSLMNPQVIASVIIQWQEGNADDFTGDPKS